MAVTRLSTYEVYGPGLYRRAEASRGEWRFWEAPTLYAAVGECRLCGERATIPFDTDPRAVMFHCRCDRIAEWIKDNRWISGKGI